MLIFSIETSCDETSFAIIKNKKILADVTITQILEQRKYGGVFPELATKLHIKNFQKLIFEVLKKAKISLDSVDYFSYTEKPGLIICLQIGKIIAQTLSLYFNKKLISCNHLIGHIYSSLINKKKKWIFPTLALIISGGHTQIYQVENHFNFNLLGETVDDSIGEFLDKSSILMGYSYPGGPIIEKLAKKGKNIVKLPFPKNDKTLNFSFSGLKSKIKKILEEKKYNNEDISCSIQYKLLEIILKKMKKAWLIKKNKTIVFGGGVIANNFLRKKIFLEIKKWDSSIEIFIPSIKYSTDNATMIAFNTYYKIKNNKNN